MPNAKRPTLSTPRYVASRMRGILRAAGFPMHRKEGRYRPFGNQQKVFPGMLVSRVGVSKTVAVSYSGDWHATGSQREANKATEARAFELLRSEGYPLDDRGWIQCEGYDNA